MHDYGLSVRGFYTQISDTDLREVIGSIARIQPNIGAKALDGALRAQGIYHCPKKLNQRVTL